jgi:hypothetical protein
MRGAGPDWQGAACGATRRQRHESTRSLAGNLVAGWQLARALLVAERELAANRDTEFMQAKAATARFYAGHILQRAARQHCRRTPGHRCHGERCVLTLFPLLERFHES